MIIGTSLDDRNLVGTSGNDVIRGLAGNDQLFGLAGNDTLDGGAGDDYVDGDDGDDTLVGGDGNDRLVGGNGNDTLDGAEGNDTLEGGNGNDTLDGGEGNDTFFAGNGRDMLRGGAGNDILAARDTSMQDASSDDGANQMFGDAGNDELTGGNGNDTLDGGVGDDDLRGGNGDDTLEGGDGNDTLAAGNGRDILRGGAGNDQLFSRTTDMQDASSDDGANQMFGDAGNDELTGGNGDDTLEGGDGNDTLLARNGRDILRGGAGNDQLFSRTTDMQAGSDDGANQMFGDAGDDELFGGNGDDTLDGGLGADKLNGGAGNDHYIVDHLSDHVLDSEGSNTGLIKVDFYKKLLGVNWTVDSGVKSLPYWIDTLVTQNAHSTYVNPIISNRIIKYAFPTQPLTEWDQDDRNGFIPMNDAQRSAIEKIFAYISTIADLRFELVSDPNQPGVLTFGNNIQKDSSGYFYGSPSGSVWTILMDINSEGNLDPKDGSRGALVFIHEIGHALGLKHPHTKNGGEAKSVDAEGPFLNETEDQSRFTMMSYTETNADYVLVFRDLDIAALQYLYGPAKVPGTAQSQTGNNRYALLDNQRNFIWDGGGTDTLDAQSSSMRLTLSLEAGGHSFFGNAASSLITNPGQITINIGTVIENAFGTAFDDVIEGNAAGNELRGLAGNDRLAGRAGDDSLVGGLGNDTLDGGEGSDTIYYNIDPIFSGVRIDMRTNQVTGASGIDTLVSIEEVWGSVFDDVFIGSDAADYFIGDKGNDIAEGNLGSDVFQINNNFLDCIVRFEGDVCVIVTKDLGTDRLSSFEFIRFVGLTTETKTVAELKASSALSTADTAAPTVTTFSPTDGATNVTASSNIVLTFNEAIRVGTGTVEIRSGSANGTVFESFNAATSARLTVSGSTLTIDPTSDLAAGTQYFVVLPSGAVRDVAGNAYAGTSTYDFTTAAASAAAATSFRLIAPDGWSGSIGGNGTIFGSAGVQDIRLLSGSIAFDASFNRGGDVVRLAGSANASSASVVGSSAAISTASGVRASVPVGIDGLFMS
ncbi:Ig-like domain-containing protein, partial [Sandarakinorhabdus limnophila]|uniref:Ig-like domain-containing protein n=1 Tax=Sandarakinorhabdus limnophila TaxID=210512 RepID=UPI0026EEF511